MLGVHRWDQSETTVTTGVDNSFVDYSGIDIIYGVNIKAVTKSNLTVSLGYEEYPMYYDASVVNINLEYKF